jgi:hypothetical protein
VSFYNALQITFRLGPAKWFKSEVVSWNWREESNNTATLVGKLFAKHNTLTFFLTNYSTDTPTTTALYIGAEASMDLCLHF